MFYDREYSPEEVRRRCGSGRQVAGITACRLDDGREAGVRCLDFRTGCGLNFTVVPDRAMDIASCEYKGLNLVYQSPTGVTAPAYYDARGTGWLHGFHGGLLTTCGLVNVGPPAEHQGEHHGLHGRIANTPASNVSHDTFWAGGEYCLAARGEMREARPFGPNLLLRRRIRATAGHRFLTLHDTVVNEGYQTVPHQILYHINAGFPLLAGPARILAASRRISPRDSDAADGCGMWAACHDPVAGYREKVYIHEPARCSDGRAWIALVNDQLAGGIGLYVKFKPETLPNWIQWKMLGEGLYVTGLEPANTPNIGTERLEAKGALPMIEPGQELDYHLEIGVLEGRGEIGDFAQEISMSGPDSPEFMPAVI